MYGKTIAAFATLLTVAGAAPPPVLAQCDSGSCTNFNLNVSADTPENFGFEAVNGHFTSNANATAAENSGDSSALGVAARGGQAQGTNTTSAGSTAANGATAGATSTSDMSVSGSAGDESGAAAASGSGDESVAATASMPADETGTADTSSVDTNIDVNVDTPENFGFGAANGHFTANANAASVETSGDSSATAIGARGGQGSASNTTSAGGTAANGATAGGSSSSSASAGPGSQ
jgi:hypothetical protein